MVRMRRSRHSFTPIPRNPFFVGLSSIHWREAWKYGERAFRYCQHDVGHALGTLRIAGAALGWRVFLLAGLDDRTIGALLGLNRLHEFEQAEPELPELLCVVCPVPTLLPPLSPPYPSASLRAGKGGEIEESLPFASPDPSTSLPSASLPSASASFGFAQDRQDRQRRGTKSIHTACHRSGDC